jgi:hypothetical protein
MTIRHRALLLAVVLTLAAAAAGRSTLAQSSLAQSSVGAVQANPLAGLSLDKLSVTRSRPLFSPSRHPPAVAAAPAAPVTVRREEPRPDIPPPNITLFGIVSDPDGVRAVIRLQSNQMRRVRVGDEVAGWTVSQIEPRRLVLTLDKRTAVFVLFGDKEGKPPPNNRQRFGLDGSPGQDGSRPGTSIARQDLRGSPAVLMR